MMPPQQEAFYCATTFDRAQEAPERVIQMQGCLNWAAMASI